MEVHEVYITSLQMVMVLIKIIIIEASARGVYYISANGNDAHKDNYN